MVLDGDLRLVSFTPLIHLLKANSVDPDQTPCTAASDTVCQTQQKILDNPLTQQADLTAIRTTRLFSVNNCYLAFIQIISDGHVDIKKRNAAVLNNFVSTDKQSTKKKKKKKRYPTDPFEISDQSNATYSNTPYM